MNMFDFHFIAYELLLGARLCSRKIDGMILIFTHSQCPKDTEMFRFAICKRRIFFRRCVVAMPSNVVCLNVLFVPLVFFFRVLHFTHGQMVWATHHIARAQRYNQHRKAYNSIWVPLLAFILKKKKKGPEW